MTYEENAFSPLYVLEGCATKKKESFEISKQINHNL